MLESAAVNRVFRPRRMVPVAQPHQAHNAPRGSIRHNRRGRRLEQLAILLLLATGDADGDDDTDGDDFLAWQAQFGSGVASTVSSATLPEPVSWLLLLTGLSAAVRLRWRLAAR